MHAEPAPTTKLTITVLAIRHYICNINHRRRRWHGGQNVTVILLLVHRRQADVIVLRLGLNLSSNLLLQTLFSSDLCAKRGSDCIEDRCINVAREQSVPGR